jgi:phosphoesterase RecJ-like protein
MKVVQGGHQHNKNPSQTLQTHLRKSTPAVTCADMNSHGTSTFPFEGEAFEELLDRLRADLHQSVVITAHRGPDGDAIGSALGFAHHLKAVGFSNVQVILPDGFPSFYNWMPGSAEILLFDQAPEAAETQLQQADWIFCLDYNDLKRLGAPMEAAVQSCSGDLVLIDHHMHPEDFAAYTFSDATCGSTAELIFRWVVAAQELNALNVQAGTCLYTGVMTDTGSFRFSSVSPATHRMVAELIEIGVDHASIHSAVYDSQRLDRLRLAGYAIAEKLEVDMEKACAWISLTNEELTRFHAVSGDTEGLVNQALSIEGINCALFIRETPEGRVKMSLRSRGKFSVREVAEAHFNGGGHHNAAGGAVENSTAAEVVATWKSLLPKYGEAMKQSVA